MDADMVLANPYRWEIDSPRRGQPRKQAFAYVFEVLAVLTVVYAGDRQPQIVSFRRARRDEREAPDVIARWRATGPGWQTRMAEVLKAAIARG